MKLALISDIHGNLPSLKAVLEDIAGQDVDQVVCLGDVANFGPQPLETLLKVRDLDIPVVLGNTDDSLLSPQREADVEKPNKDTPLFLDIEAWAAEQMTPEARDYLRRFEPTLEFKLDFQHSLLCAHGSPRSYNDPITATTPADTLDDYLAGVSAGLVAVGHTHRPFYRRHRDIILVNPGSVGLPYETARDGDEVRNPPWAEYALLESSRDQPVVSFRRVPYDSGEVVAAARKSGMPHLDRWLRGWL